MVILIFLQKRFETISLQDNSDTIESMSDFVRPTLFFASFLNTTLPLSKTIIVGTAWMLNLSQSGFSSSSMMEPNLFAFSILADSNVGLKLAQYGHHVA